jgi:hypothetical protein
VIVAIPAMALVGGLD